jgi:outer membrane receptor protein involved in Fe transport
MHSLEIGVDAAHHVSEYDNLYEEFTDASGDTTPALTVKDELTGNTLGFFLNYIVSPTVRLTATLGLRADQLTLGQNWHLSPRLGVTYRLTDRTSLSAATGIYYQELPSLLLAQDDANRDLKEPRALHYVAGLEHLITESTKLSIEAYFKDYEQFPIDPTQPSLFVIDEIYYRYGFFLGHGQLEDSGKARSKGIELLVQKKLAKDLYGLASASYFRSTYCGGDGIWRDRVFDNRYLVSIEGGYKPGSSWEFSLRWIYAGGPPYTPFDEQRSIELGRGVLDLEQISAHRYPDYHSLNLRVDRRFHFSKTNLTVYFSMWNAYNRKNVATYYWNVADNTQDTIYQWGILPVFGVEYEF